MARSLKRSLGFATFGAPFLLVVALSACGDDDDAEPGGGSTVLIQPSSFITASTGAPGATTVPAGSAPAAGEPGTRATGTQVYVVQGGDSLFAIADDFDVEAEEIANFNDWPEGIEHPLFPDAQINIPPDALIPSPDEPEDTEAASESSEDEADEEDEAPEETTAEQNQDNPHCADGSVQGTYTIRDTDTTRAGVAERLDVTVAQLDEANANTPGYGGFIVGIEILVPCGDDTASESTE